MWKETSGMPPRKGCELTEQELSHLSETRDHGKNQTPSTIFLGFQTPEL